MFAYDEALAHAAGIAHIAPSGKVLLLRRAASEKNYPGYWALPGGGGNAGETPLMTALREAREEIGDITCGIGEIPQIYEKVTPTGVVYHTFLRRVSDEFVPALNDEHSAYNWTDIASLPNDTHPAVIETLSSLAATPAPVAIPDFVAMDRETVRSRDADGHLHVGRTPISKANVCPYYGSEIPGAEQLGLVPTQIYQMLRAPDELMKGATTFARKPLLLLHKPVNANDHPRTLTVGTIGDDIQWHAPYLTAPLTVWDGEAIALIETAEQRQLSAGYRYRPDMTPGVYEGVRYDGVMRDIVANHVALVREGRAGPDVVVSDEKFKLGCRITVSDVVPQTQEIIVMAKKLSRMGLVAAGALTAYLNPRIAQDKSIDLTQVLKDVTAKNYNEMKGTIVESVTSLVAGKLAQDANIGDLAELLNALSGTSIDETDTADSTGESENADNESANSDGDGDKPTADNGNEKKSVKDEVLALLKGKLSDDDLAAIASVFDGGAAENKESDDMVDKQAMDAAISAAVTKVRSDTIAEMQRRQAAIRLAEKDIKPYVGELPIAQDSAENVYRSALTALGVKDVDKLHESALRHVLLAQPLPGSRSAAPQPTAMDAASAATFSKLYPNASIARTL